MAGPSSGGAGTPPGPRSGPAAEPDAPDPAPRYRIGEAAELAAVSPRTLRWYEEIDLVHPAGHSAGGARRYSEADVARIARIRELQTLLGMDLGEIRAILAGEDALAGLRVEYRRGPGPSRRREILLEATTINEKLTAVVGARQELLAAMTRDLEERAGRYAALLAELEEETGEGSGDPGDRDDPGDDRGPVTPGR